MPFSQIFSHFQHIRGPLRLVAEFQRVLLATLHVRPKIVGAGVVFGFSRLFLIINYNKRALLRILSTNLKFNALNQHNNCYSIVQLLYYLVSSMV